MIGGTEHQHRSRICNKDGEQVKHCRDERDVAASPEQAIMAGPEIFIGLGANLPSVGYGAPKATLTAALERLAGEGLRIVARSRWYESAPVPRSDQPWFVNAVVRVDTRLTPPALLQLLHRVEEDFGRVRGERNAARAIDLDLLSYGDKVTRGAAVPRLPHPRMQERAFVLMPLREIAPRWRHPLLRHSLDELIAALPPEQVARPLA
jgi:2-amino-4-hydroxy-6-hydroxymethyldihydropteridine diphosphokinase